MSAGPNLRAGILAAKDRLAAGREKLRLRHVSGTPGAQVASGMADLFDLIVLDLFEAILEDQSPELARQTRSQVTLVPHGGFGRRDVAPYSDVDLMVLYHPSFSGRVSAVAGRLFRDLNDAGLTVGNSVRSTTEALRLVGSDTQICTSLMESRYLAGSAGLFATFARRMQRYTSRKASSLLPAIEQSRQEERAQFGETVYLLEPNIKRSRGSLRDMQLLRWIGYVAYGSTDLESLRMSGALSQADYKAVRAAREFLLRLRNELHFHAGRANDQFDRAEQLRVAGVFGIAGDRAVLPVERYMQEYFSHTRNVSQIVTRFIDASRPGRWWREFFKPLVAHRVGDDYWAGPTTIRATQQGREKLKSDLSEVIRLAEIAHLYQMQIDFETSEVVRQAARELPQEIPAEAARRFLELLDRPVGLGNVLRNLHDLGILERVVPAFKHARSLLQFNQYHKFTIDEHCLMAVQKAADFAADGGPLGVVYNSCRQRRILHLALLVHDLGKGFEEDHSEVGRRIALETAALLRLSSHDSETLAFLVHKHLMMSHLAFRRDTSDPELVLRFAVDVGSPEVLQMLYLLTAADLAAVGPGVLNDWKADVLTDLYARAMQHLSGDRRSLDTTERLFQQREQVREELGSDTGEWYDEQIDSLPANYLHSTSAARIADELRQLHSLASDGVWASSRYQAETDTTEYVVATRDNVTPGVFHKLAGTLSSRGLQVLSAEINTLRGGLVLDRFYVKDGDFNGVPPTERMDSVTRALRESLNSQTPPPLHLARRYGRQRNRPELTQLPTQVRIDNSTSDKYTIIDVFAADRIGLLYVIGRTLFELELSVALAKIGTHLDQVVDVFYVTENSGAKILKEKRLTEIRERLFADIESFENASAESEKKSS